VSFKQVRLLGESKYRGEASTRFWGYSWDMPAPQNQNPKGKITLSLHGLYVEVEHHASYPDQLDDISNRAYELFVGVMDKAKLEGIDLYTTRSYEFEDDDEDEDAD
jgi:hypothetical protein